MKTGNIPDNNMLKNPDLRWELLNSIMEVGE